MPDPIKIIDRNGDEMELPSRWEVCTVCDGEGKHSHAVDGNDITASEWAEWHPDERETYLRGGYDQQCEECKGKRVVAVVDEDRLTDEQRREWESWAEDERRYRASVEAERRMGC